MRGMAKTSHHQLSLFFNSPNPHRPKTTVRVVHGDAVEGCERVQIVCTQPPPPSGQAGRHTAQLEFLKVFYV